MQIDQAIRSALVAALIILAAEIQVLVWARAMLSRSDKSLFHDVLRSRYRFFWLPKAFVGFLFLIAFMFAANFYYTDGNPDNLWPGIVASITALIYLAMAADEAFRTTPKSNEE